MKIKILLLFTIVFFYSFTSSALVDSIYHQGGYRTFIVHLPTGYTTSNTYPLILNFHGLNSNAAEQELYTGFDVIADTAQFIVVYPQGINNAWNLSIGTPDDVNFTSVLIDSLIHDYSIDAGCVYSTGLSNGAFLSYILACSLSNKLAAVAPVAGNMATLQQTFCFPVKGMPIMEIHGTADAIVSYNGSLGIPSVPATLKWWVIKNNCDTTPVIVSLPDINILDGCAVTKYTYSNGQDNSEVIHYKIAGGGHTWAGGIPVIALGNTCQDFNASVEIWKFFRKYCAHSTSVNEVTENEACTIYPNPAHETIMVIARQLTDKIINCTMYNLLGEVVNGEQSISKDGILDIAGVTKGIYFIHIQTEKETVNKKIVVQ